MHLFNLDSLISIFVNLSSRMVLFVLLSAGCHKDRRVNISLHHAGRLTLFTAPSNENTNNVLVC